MQSLRVTWLAGWGGVAVGSVVAGADVLGDTGPFWIAGVCALIALIGYIRLRWRREPFDVLPQVSTVGKVNRLLVKYEVGSIQGGLNCRLKHPSTVRVMAASLYRGGQSMENIEASWTTGSGRELQSRRRNTRLRLYTPRPRKGDVICFNLAAEEPFSPGVLRLQVRD